MNDIEIIERYFDNDLTKEEISTVEERLNMDDEFRKLFDREKLLMNTIRYQGAQKDLSFLKEKERSLSRQQPRTYLNSYRFYLAAAACVALIALMVIIPWRGGTSDDLFTSYFKPYPNVFEPTLRGDPYEISRAQAFQAYEQEDYGRASELFSTLVDEHSEPGMLLLLGNANLMLGRTGEAKANFTELIDTSDELDIEAKWYLGLIGIKTGETEKAKQLFEEISVADHAYAAKARDVLKELR